MVVVTVMVAMTIVVVMLVTMVAGDLFLFQPGVPLFLHFHLEGKKHIVRKDGVGNGRQKVQSRKDGRTEDGRNVRRKEGREEGRKQ
jgi:hypothetical protein